MYGYGGLTMRSDAVFKGTQQAPHRSLFNALGLTGERVRFRNLLSEFAHPNHGEAESGTRTGLGINREGTFFRTSN